MQPQSAQNMYVSQNASNGTGIVRTNQPNSGAHYRPSHTTSSSAPRNPFITNTMYHLSAVQSVVPQQYSYPSRQPQYTQYPYNQYYPQNSFYSYYQIQQPSQHQRSNISVNSPVGVGVGNSMSTTSTHQTQIALNVSSVSNGTSVGGITASAMVGVLQSSHVTSRKPRPHALEIIDPNTNRNILDDLKSGKNALNTNVDFDERVTLTPRVQSNTTLEQSQMKGGFLPALRKCVEDIQIDAKSEIVPNCETPVVSAISNAPSVEIYPQMKTKTKKLQTLKERGETFPTCDENISQKPTAHIVDPIEKTTDCVNELTYPNDMMPQSSETSLLKTNNNKRRIPVFNKKFETKKNYEEESISNEAPVIEDICFIDRMQLKEKCTSETSESEEVTLTENIVTNALVKSNELVQKSLDNGHYNKINIFLRNQSNKECKEFKESFIENEVQNLDNLHMKIQDFSDDVNKISSIQFSSERASFNNFKYDRDQLIKLRNVEASRILPDIKFISILPGLNLMPAFASKKFPLSLISGSRSGDGSIQKNYCKDSTTSGGKNSRSRERDVIHVNLLLNQDVKLNESSNAWRPGVLKKIEINLEDPDVREQQEKEDIIRKVRGILNKLTPEKFDPLLKEVMKLKIDTMDKLDAVMILVFEKAIEEPNFSVCYAQLCHRLISEVTPKKESKSIENEPKTNLMHFRCSLLDKAHREFTCNVINAKAKEQKLKPLKDKMKNCTDTNEEIEVKTLLEEEERKIRRRSSGTVRFIGELFKYNILSCAVIVSCIQDLIKNPHNQDMLECLCKLLTTVGKKLEQTRLPKEPVRYYSLENVILKMQAISLKSDSSKISSRVRFMLQDVIDLRKNKWKSTRTETPTTMDQIEKEARYEQLSSNYSNYGLLPNSGAQGFSKQDNRYGDNRSGYNGSHSQRSERLRSHQFSSGGGSHSTDSNINNDGTWHTQTSKSSRSVLFDTNKLGAMRMTDIGTKKMGTASQFQWDKTTIPIATPSNSFAVLSSSESNNKSGNDSDRETGCVRNKNSYHRDSFERDRYGEKEKAPQRRSTSHEQHDGFSYRSSQAHTSITTPLSTIKNVDYLKCNTVSTPTILAKPANVSTLNVDDNNIWNKKTDFIVQQSKNEEIPNAAPTPCFKAPNSNDLSEFKALASELVENTIHSKEINNHVVSCMKRLKDTQRCGFMYYILTDYLHLRDVNTMNRRHLSNCVAYLIHRNFVSIEHFKLAYTHFSERVKELILDIPQMWLYIFEFAGLLILKNLINIRDLWRKKYTNYGTKICISFLGSFLQYFMRDIGPNYTKEFWKKQNLKWTEFIPESEVANFIKINNFEYIENDKAQPVVYVKESSDNLYRRIFDHMNQILSEGANADHVIDFLNGNITGADIIFIRRLTTTLGNFAIKYNSNSYKLDISCFQKLCIPVFLRYINSEEELELECLYALQQLDYNLEHPRDLLRDLFMELNDNDVIQRETFLTWRDSKEHTIGKGVAVKALNPFFNQVLNGETSDDN